MKILPVKFIQANKTSNVNRQKPNNYSLENSTTYKETNLNNIPHYISFKKDISNQQIQAIKYLNKQTKELKKENINPSILDYDLNKLEGIQEGIKIFEGLNLKEIVFLISTLTEIAVLRGCFNNCAHCYAEAKPPVKEKDNYISRMDWQDFIDLLSGIDELQKRLGFKIKIFEKEYMTLFHDADCSQIYIKDAEGNIHDWAEMAKLAYKITDSEQLFDTSGWYIQDKKAQERVEKYVKEIVETDNDFIYKVNISINPFQALYYKAVEGMREGNKQKEDYFKEKDKQRMANTLFTLTPIIKTGKLYLLPRAMDNNSKNSQGYSCNDLKKTYNKIYFETLQELYLKDLYTDRKIIKSQEDIRHNIDFLKKQLSVEMDSNLTVTNKLKKIFRKNSKETQKTKKLIVKSPQKFLDKHSLNTIIDANGDVYITNFVETYKTDLQLNFKNKNKKTSPIAPNLCDENITKEMIRNKIEDIYKN